MIGKGEKCGAGMSGEQPQLQEHPERVIGTTNSGIFTVVLWTSEASLNLQAALRSHGSGARGNTTA